MSRKPNILIIDDDESMLDSCTQVFAKEGYQTTTADNGDSGLQKYGEKETDLVLVDLKMPGKDGMEVLKELNSIDPNCVAVVITGYGTIQSAVEAMKHGAYDFLPKPFTPDELRFIVQRGLERRQYIVETETLRNEKEMMRKNFVSLVSHELRSPLAAVQQNLYVLTGGIVGEIPAKADEILVRIQERIRGLINLINDWLDLSRIESGQMISEMVPVDLSQVVTDVVETLKPLAEDKKVSVAYNPPAKLPNIQGDRRAIEILLMNLVNNGIKYNKYNGSLEIALETDEDSVRIFVKDTGIGIPEEKKPFIFEQFYRTRGGDNVGGSGLGLSIAQKIVEVHNGTIDVESEVDVGTTFIVRLPTSGQAEKPRSHGQDA